MPTKKINGAKLKEAIHNFGSLAKAIDALGAQKQSMEKDIAELAMQTTRLEKKKSQQLAELEELKNKIKNHEEYLQTLNDYVEQKGRQWDLFESFMAMIFTSPSTDKLRENLIASLQKVSETGWRTGKQADDLRSLFVRTVLGDYLRCFRCSICGASFIVNREPRYQSIDNHHYCPACHSFVGVEGDDSFLKAMVSQEQLENTRRVEEFKAENDKLAPLRVFQCIPCEVCGEPMTAWTKEEAERAVKGWGCGHSACWATAKGQAKQFAKLLREELDSRSRHHSERGE